MAAAAQSHFDTTLGLVHFNLAPPAEIPELIEVLDQIRSRRKESAQAREHFADVLDALLHTEHYPLLAHEGAHVLQALTHPALFLRCLREFSAVSTVIDELRKIPEAIPLPLSLHPRWKTELEWSALPLRVAVGADGLPTIVESSSRWPMPNDLSEVDLLEGSASIFEYKASVGGDGDERLFRNWLGERYRYSKAFDFVAAVLSPEDAYVALPSLVMVAHGSNWPVHAFIALLAMTATEAPMAPSEMGVDRFHAFLESSFAESLPVGEPPDPRASMADEGEQRRIDRQGMLALAAKFPWHPLTPLVELAWNDESNAARLREAILHPTQAFDRRKRNYRDWFLTYRPPAAAIRIHGGGFGVSDTILQVSPTLMDREPPESAESWPTHLIELGRMKSFVFSTATEQNRLLPHNCPHEKCAYHRYDMCRTWMNIPEVSTDCNFPKWVREGALRRLNFMTGELEPV